MVDESFREMEDEAYEERLEREREEREREMRAAQARDRASPASSAGAGARGRPRAQISFAEAEGYDAPPPRRSHALSTSPPPAVNVNRGGSGAAASRDFATGTTGSMMGLSSSINRTPAKARQTRLFAAAMTGAPDMATQHQESLRDKEAAAAAAERERERERARRELLEAQKLNEEKRARGGLVDANVNASGGARRGVSIATFTHASRDTDSEEEDAHAALQNPDRDETDDEGEDKMDPVERQIAMEKKLGRFNQQFKPPMQEQLQTILTSELTTLS